MLLDALCFIEACFFVTSPGLRRVLGYSASVKDVSPRALEPNETYPVGCNSTLPKGLLDLAGIGKGFASAS